MGCMNERTDEWIDRCRDAYTSCNGLCGGLGWMNKRTDGQTDGRMDGQTLTGTAMSSMVIWDE